MPNHVTNQITFGTDDASLAAFHHMLHEMRVEGQHLGSFDFNKLIPMPQELNIKCGSKTGAGLKMYKEFIQESTVVASVTMFASEDVQSAAVVELLEKWDAIEKTDPEAWELGKKAFQNIQKYGCPTWYGWCTEHWGTKWNAYQCVPLDSAADTMVFLTACSPVPKLIKILSSRYPNQEIVYRWADEYLGYNVGKTVYKNGEEIDGVIPAEGSRTAYKMSAEIIGRALSGRGLFLPLDRSPYQYRKEPLRHSDPQLKKDKKKNQAR